MRRVLVTFWLGVAAQVLMPAPAGAEDAARHFIFFSGSDLSSLSAFSWTGIEAPLRGRGSGPILRAMGGFGAYDYAAEDAPGGAVRGRVMLGEVLAGWRRIEGDVCLTLFAGVAAEDHEIDVADPNNRVQGTETGLKLAAELSWRPSARLQVEAAAAYAATFDFWRLRLVAGHAFSRASFGAEAEAFGNHGSHQVRLGVFASDIAWRAFTFKASAGALHDGEEAGMYGRLSMDRRF